MLTSQSHDTRQSTEFPTRTYMLDNVNALDTCNIQAASMPPDDTNTMQQDPMRK